MLNERLTEINKNIKDYICYNTIPTSMSFGAFDIEACYIKSTNSMLTYSLALKSVEEDMCYLYKDIKLFIDDLMDHENDLMIYAHNCKYDMTPIIIYFTEMFGNNFKKVEVNEKKQYNPYKKQWESINYEIQNNNDDNKLKPYEYSLLMKDGIFYQLQICNKKGYVITLRDSMKLAPFSLQKCSKDFIGLYLPKDGLDYEKERNIEEEFTEEELVYIYNDVYGLSHLLDYLIITGVDINGKHIAYTSLTNSGQSLKDYKMTLLEDFENKQNGFSDIELYDYVDTVLMNKGYYRREKKNKEAQKASYVFSALYPELSIFGDKWVRHSYYGGLCTPHYENIEKFKNKHIVGSVFDVNSLYPFVMKTRLLPYGHGSYSPKSYIDKCKEDKEYSAKYPLYIQELTIYKLDLKKNKMHFLQIKNSTDFKGTDILKNNINKKGERVTLKVRLCNPMLDKLFECYDVVCDYNGHMAFQGANNLFENYINFWGEVKQNNKDGKRAIAKLRQNGLYGKFGMSKSSHLTHFENVDSKFTIVNDNVEVTGDGVYLPMATFITSYAKAYLLENINNNFKYFMYCDTDSIHLACPPNKVKGLKVDKKIYGAWDNEASFIEYKYIGAKRYAENIIQDNKSNIKLDNIILTKWTFKCCGLTAKIMNSITNAHSFNKCSHSQKELNNMRLYQKGVHYFYDKEYTKIIQGVYASNKSKLIKYGTKIEKMPYKITDSSVSFK